MRPTSKNDDPLVRCPNFGTCQTMVARSKKGLEHRYRVYDPLSREYVFRDCPGNP